METKRCCLCGEDKPATDEHFAVIRARVRKDGYTNRARRESRCRPCLTEARRPHSAARHERERVRRMETETKICTKCGKEQPIENFYCTLVKATDKRRAYTYVRVPCKKCHKTYVDLRYQKTKSRPIQGRVKLVPLPTREELAEWHAAGCPLGNRKAA